MGYSKQSVDDAYMNGYQLGKQHGREEGRKEAEEGAALKKMQALTSLISATGQAMQTNSTLLEGLYHNLREMK